MPMPATMDRQQFSEFVERDVSQLHTLAHRTANDPAALTRDDIEVLHKQAAKVASRLAGMLAAMEDPT